jgi:hypothetical protein
VFAFPGSDTGFCQVTDTGQVFITFGSAPPGCIDVSLRVYGGKSPLTIWGPKLNAPQSNNAKMGGSLGLICQALSMSSQLKSSRDLVSTLMQLLKQPINRKQWGQLPLRGRIQLRQPFRIVYP